MKSQSSGQELLENSDRVSSSWRNWVGMKSDRRKFRMVPVTCWVIALAGGSLALWILLSFLIYLPIDESKVHPDVKSSRFASASSWVVQQEANKSGVYLSEWISQGRSPSLSYRFPDVNKKPRVMVIQNTYLAALPPEVTEVSLDEYPHTRRSVIRSIERKRIPQYDEIDVGQITRDPFVRTRIAVRNGIARLRDRFGW